MSDTSKTKADLDFLVAHIKLIIHLLDLDDNFNIEHSDKEIEKKIGVALKSIVDKIVEVDTQQRETQ